MQRRQTRLRRASISLRAIQRGLNTIQEVALIERLGQIADDPSLKCAGTNIIARIRRYQYGGNLFAQCRTWPTSTGQFADGCDPSEPNWAGRSLYRPRDNLAMLHGGLAKLMRMSIRANVVE